MLKWTQEMADMLAQMWREGKSGSECADELNNRFGCSLTRRACIGKIARLRNAGVNLRRRPRGGDKPRRKVILAKARSHITGPPKPDERIDLGAKDVFQLSANRKMCGDGIEMADKRLEHCSWPLHHEDGHIVFCGRMRVKGAYCEAHHKVAYRKD